MRSLCIIFALIISIPAHGSEPLLAYLNSPIYDKLKQGFSEITTELSLMQMLMDGMNGKATISPADCDTLKDQACHIATAYARAFGSNLETVPLLPNIKARVVGAQDYYVLSGVNGNNQGLFNNEIIDQSRTKGFVFGEIKGFSLVETAIQGKYLVELRLGLKPPNEPQEAVYKGAIKLLKWTDVERRRGYKSLDLAGPDGRRLSLALQAKHKPTYRNLQKAINLLLEKHAFIQSTIQPEPDGIQDVYVSRSVPRGLYGFSYEAAVDDDMENIGIVSIHSINTVSREVIYATRGVQDGVQVEPGFKVEFNDQFDPYCSYPNCWFAVDKDPDRSPFFMWLDADWAQLESRHQLRFGQEYIQLLFECLHYLQETDGYSRTKSVVSGMDKYISLVLRPSFLEDLSPRFINSSTSSAMVSPRDMTAEFVTPRTAELIEINPFVSDEKAKNTKEKSAKEREVLNKNQSLPVLFLNKLKKWRPLGVNDDE
jgi:hypothetical protein